MNRVRVALANLAEEEACRKTCDDLAAFKLEAWSDILTEEVAEAYGAKSPEHLREELVQIAATAVAWLESLDARAAAADTVKIAIPKAT